MEEIEDNKKSQKISLEVKDELERKERNRLLAKAFKKMATFDRNDPRLYINTTDLDITECPLCGEVFFGLADIASHTWQVHKVPYSAIIRGTTDYNPSRR